MTVTPNAEPPSLPGATETLQLLEDLRGRIRGTIEQEDSLSQDLRQRRYKLNRQRDHAVEGQQQSLEEKLADLNAAYDTEADRYRARYEGRRDLIQQLTNTAKRDVPKDVENARARYLGRLQWRQRDAEATHQREWSAFDTALSQWSERLEEQHHRLRRLERAAARAFSAFGSLKRLLQTGDTKVEVPPAPDADERARLLEKLSVQIDRAENGLRDYHKQAFPKLFRVVPLPAWLLIAVVAGLVSSSVVGFHQQGLITGGAVAGGLIAILLLLRQIAGGQGREEAEETATALRQARAQHDALHTSLETQRVAEKKRLDTELKAEMDAVQKDWDKVDAVGEAFEKKRRAKLEAQPPRMLALVDQGLERRLQRVENGRAQHIGELEKDTGARNDAATFGTAASIEKLDEEETRSFADLGEAWNRDILPLHRNLAELGSHPDSEARSWDSTRIQEWSPPSTFPSSIRFGEMQFDLAAGEDALPKHDNLQLSLPSTLRLPLALGFPRHSCVLIESEDACPPEVASAFNQMILRILTSVPAGRATFTILDPVGLGQNFAGLMHLADYEETLIQRRIWTQRDQIDERMAELSEHVEKVIQMYLRNEYETITEYNEKAGSVAEKYHFLIIADFPTGFSETAVQRLQSLAVSGARCGVFTLMHWNRSQPIPEDFLPEELRANSLHLRFDKTRGFTLNEEYRDLGARITLDPAPDDETALELVHRIGQASVDSNRIEVPFDQVAPPPEALWEDSTTQELRVAIGRTGATKLQYLSIGKGTKQHALFAGKTGSGKSTLFHVIITNLALHCSPDEVEFYLIDFKKGVEFKCYGDQQLPHARVVAIESDREFGLSVLQRVDDELKRRGDLFRKHGAQDVAGYRKSGGTEPLPRTLLLIDEFQEFFVEDDTVAQNASLLFDRIVRQGRAFGIHVLLGSQTLGGAYTLARTTLGQMVIRVALQCNEADAYLIMDENNPAPRLLTRPGEGIYNDAAGAIEGNSPFQVVWLNDDERDQHLRRVRELAEERGIERDPPIVFEGNAPADVAGNVELGRWIQTATEPPATPSVWLGAPNAIKGPTKASFSRQSGSHLIVVGQQEEATLAMFSLALVALAAQFRNPESARIVLFHGSAPGSSEAVYLEGLIESLPVPVQLVAVHQTEAAMKELHDELQARTDAASNDAPPVFALVHGLHRFKKLRHEDDFDFSLGGDDSGPKPGAMFNTLITEGSSVGMHLMVSLDTYNNVSRCLSRKALSEFEMRVVFQMSANDSASLIESTAGSNLGLHRALFYNEQQGTLETFRPYALPEQDWLQSTAAQLKGT